MSRAVSYFLAIAVLDVPRYLVDVFGIHAPLLGGDPPYFLLPSLVIGAWLYLGALNGGRASLFHRSDFLLLGAIALWGGLELVHAAGSATIHLDLIRTNLWFLAFLCLLRLFRLHGIEDRAIVVTFANVILGWGALHLLLLALCTNGWEAAIGVNRLEVFNRNSLSMVASLGILLCLVRSDVGRLRAGVLVAVCLGCILWNNSRGVLLITLALGAILGLRMLISGRRVLQLTALIGIVGVLSLAFVRLDAIFENPAEAITSRFGRNDALASYDNFVSSHSRLETNRRLIESFVDKPVLGAGVGEVKSHRVFGFVSHTYWLFPIAAYGIVGSLLYYLYWLVVFLAFRRSPTQLFACSVFVIGHMTFSNDLWSWYAIVPWLAALPVEGTEGTQNACQVS